MVTQTFQTIQVSDPTLNRIQGNISNAFNAVSGPFIGGNILTGVKVGTSATAINHKLGRTPILWVICDQDTQTSVSRSDWNATSITLSAGSACTVSIWVN